MFFRIFFAFALVAIVAAQYIDERPCGFVCTRNASFVTVIDGVKSRASCSDGNISDRCESCCRAYAMTRYVFPSNAAAFPSNDGKSCICCLNYNRC